MWVRGPFVLLCVLLAGCSPKKDTSPPTAEPTAAESAVDATEPDRAEEEAEPEPEEEDEAAEESEASTEPLEEDGPVTFKLHNLCKRAVSYGLGPLEGQSEFEDAKTIKAGKVEEITVPFGIGVHLLQEGGYGAAATVNGGHVWISSSCKGVGSSKDPNADPAKLDKELREDIERLKKQSEAASK